MLSYLRPNIYGPYDSQVQEKEYLFTNRVYLIEKPSGSLL